MPRASSGGTDPHNADPTVHAGRACGTRCCRCSSASSARGSRAGARPHRRAAARRHGLHASRFELDAYARARTDDGIDMLEIDDVGRRDPVPLRAPGRHRPGAIASELTRAHVLAVLGLLGQQGQADPAPRPRHGVRRRRGAALQADHRKPDSPECSGPGVDAAVRVRSHSGLSDEVAPRQQREASARGWGRRRRGCRGRQPATGWTITSSTSYDARERPRSCAAAEAGVPMTQRLRHRLDPGPGARRGPAPSLPPRRGAAASERLAGTQRDHRLQLRQGEPVGLLLRRGDHHVDGQERARRAGSSRWAGTLGPVELERLGGALCRRSGGRTT